MKKTLWIILAAFTLTCLGMASGEAATRSGKATTHLASKKNSKKHKKKHKKQSHAAHRHLSRATA